MMLMFADKSTTNEWNEQTRLNTGIHASGDAPLRKTIQNRTQTITNTQTETITMVNDRDLNDRHPL